MPEVTIIVTSIEMFEMTKKCISTLIENTTNVNYEIIVNDSSKTTKTIDWMKTLKIVPIKFIHSKPSSDTDAVMDAYSKAIQSKYIVVMNNDIFVMKNWLLPLIKIMESDEKIGMIAPLILVSGGKGIYTAGAGNLVSNGGKKFVAWNWKKKLIIPVGYVIASCILIRRSVIEKIGGIYDRQFKYWKNDIDLCIRMWKAGYKICTTNLSEVLHLTGQTTKWRRQSKDVERANQAFSAKYSENDIRCIMIKIIKLQEGMGLRYTNPKHTINNPMRKF